MTKHMRTLPGAAQPDTLVVPKRYVFLLLRSCSAFDLTAAIEALKEANRLDRTDRYKWLLLSEDGRACPTSNGMNINVDEGLIELDRRDTLIVFGGDAFTESSTLPVMAWLRRQARKGITIGSVSSGVFALLKAGIIPGARVATHWSYRTSLQETHLDVDVGRSIFELEGNRFTCAGGVATIDLFLRLIARDYGAGVATWVADNLVCSTPRTGKEAQTISDSCRSGIRNEKVAKALQIMSDTIEAPLSPSSIADQVGISTRQLERLFLRTVHATPKSYYTKLRVEKARMLLIQTNMKLIEIALACGFNSASHFSKIYKRHYGIPPNEERGVNFVA